MLTGESCLEIFLLDPFYPLEIVVTSEEELLFEILDIEVCF
jgi:hypothetical protein